MDTIYRLECDNQQGPYRSNKPRAEAVPYASAAGSHGLPVPEDDTELCDPWIALGWDQQGFSFGFRSLELLYTWFRSRIFQEQADKYGFRISVIEVSGRVLHGTFQSVFETATRKTIQRMTFAEANAVIDYEELTRLDNLAAMFANDRLSFNRIRATSRNTAPTFQNLASTRLASQDFSKLEERVIMRDFAALPSLSEIFGASPATIKRNLSFTESVRNANEQKQQSRSSQWYRRFADGFDGATASVQPRP